MFSSIFTYLRLFLDLNEYETCCISKCTGC